MTVRRTAIRLAVIFFKYGGCGITVFEGHLILAGLNLL